MPVIDIDHLRRWIGREETAEDVITAGLLRRFRATLGADSFPSDQAPPGLHWCLAPTAVPNQEMGEDGHPTLGGFLPPVPLSRRMWAGGEVQFLKRLKLDDVVRRQSSIENVEVKSGKSGTLCFVTVRHNVLANGQLCINERQDIVYREAHQKTAAATQTATASSSPLQAGDASMMVDASPPLLFRYSALTFNAHRIHYDREYAMEEEGYSGLVVHGPLQATQLMHFAEQIAKERIKTFSFRGLAPLIQGAAYTINANLNTGGEIDCWTGRAERGITMKGSATTQ
jgi:3-methylfumaryl-CoA hydratase